MDKQEDATFQEVFSQVRLADSIKLLPWCISSTVPLCYMNGPLATTAQQDEDVPATTTASDPEDSMVAAPSNGQACPPRTLPLPVLPLPDIPFVGSPVVGHPFAKFLAIPTQESGATLLVAHLVIIMTGGPVLTPKRSRLRVNTALHGVMRTCPKLVLEAGASFNQQQGQEPTRPLPVQTGPLLILMTVLWQEVWGVPVIRPHLTQTHPGRI